MTAPLKLALPFIEGETLSGYVSRNAKLHETTPRDFCSDLGMRWPFLCSGRDHQIERLAWLLGVQPSLLKTWRTRKIGIGRYEVGRAIASTGTLRRTAVRLCPRCVESALSDVGSHGLFQMLEWSILCIERCAHHGCQLMTIPSAEFSHATYDFVTRVMEHSDEISRASDSCVLLPDISFEAYVRRRIWRGPEDDWLKDLELTQIHRGSLSLGAAMSGFKEKFLKNLPSTELRSFSQIGFERLVDGPDAYREALIELHRQSGAEKPYYTTDFGPHYSWLREAQKEPAMKAMIDVAREHVFDTYPTPTGKRVFGEQPKERIWLSMEEARRRTNLGVVFLKLLLGHLDGISKAEALKRTELSVKEVERAKAYRDTLLNLKDAASRLGILPQQVKGLQIRGVLNTIKITSSLRYLLREQVDGLVKKVETLPHSLPGKSTVPLKEFCRAKGVHLARVIELWDRGRLEGKVCRGDGAGLQALELDWNALCGKTTIRLDRDLELTETASYLQISVISIRRLRDAGYLEVISRRNPDTNHLKQYVSKQSILEFERQYVTLGQLAQDQNVRPIHLARKFERENLEPITCIAGYVRVYLKDGINGWFGKNV